MYSVRYRPQVATLALQRWCCSLAFPVGERSWRTRRMARHKRNVSDLPYAASPFYCVAFFVKVQNGYAAALAAEWKRGGVKTFHCRLRLFLCSEIEDSHHQFGLQPFPNVVVYAKVDIPALVIQFPHG